MATHDRRPSPIISPAERAHTGMVAYCPICGVHVVTTVGDYDKGVWCTRDHCEMFTCMWMCRLDVRDTHTSSSPAF